MSSRRRVVLDTSSDEDNDEKNGYEVVQGSLPNSRNSTEHEVSTSSSFTTSTPKSTRSSNTVNTADLFSNEDNDSNGSINSREDMNRSRSFHNEPPVHSPISKKLSSATDTKSKQDLRERMMRKTFTMKKASRMNSTESNEKSRMDNFVWGKGSEDKSNLSSTTLSPISKEAPAVFNSDSRPSNSKFKSAVLKTDFKPTRVHLESSSEESVQSASMQSIKSNKYNANLNSTFTVRSINGYESKSEGDDEEIVADSVEMASKSSVVFDSEDDEADDEQNDEEVDEDEESDGEFVDASQDMSTSDIADSLDKDNEDKNSSVVDKSVELSQSLDIIELSSDENDVEDERGDFEAEQVDKFLPVSPSKSAELRRLPLVELENKRISLKKLLAYKEGLPDGGAKLMSELRAIDQTIEKKLTLPAESADHRTASNSVEIFDDEVENSIQIIEEPEKPQRVIPKIFKQPKKGPIIISPQPQDYKKLVQNDQKRMFAGGQMTENRTNRINAITDKVLKNLHDAVTTAPDDQTATETPDGIRIDLMPHQKVGLTWLLWRENQPTPGGILADDMGLGKTLSMISLIVQQKKILREKRDTGDEGYKRRREAIKELGFIPSNATLVVAPASLIFQWEKEISTRVRPDLLSVYMYHGNKREKEARRLARYDVVITTYALVGNELTEKITTGNNGSDSDDEDESGKKGKPRKRMVGKNDSPLAQICWARVILDEAHAIKNRTTAQSKAACRLSATSRWCLTGTPIHNELWDFFSLIKFLRVTPFCEEKYWKDCIMPMQTKMADRLNLLIKNLLLRRDKTQQCPLTNKRLVDLKDKVFKEHVLELEGPEAAAYDILFEASRARVQEILEQNENENNVSGVRRPRKNCNNTERDIRNPFLQGPRTIRPGEHFQQMSSVLVMLLRLRQACVHFHLTKNGLDLEAFETIGGDGEKNDEVDDMLDKTLANLTLDESFQQDVLSNASLIFERNFISTKFKKLFEIVDKIIADGDKCVIVSQWTSLLEIAEDQLKKRKLIYTSITGSVMVQDRQSRVDSFNKVGKGAQVMLLSLTAGGVGLNLVGGNHLILMDLHWNPALEQQACDRIYRMGQQKDVVIHKLVVKGTIEGRVLQLQERKMTLAKNILDGAASKKMNKLTMADLRFLFDLEDKE